jgi:hypothetical protein
MTAKNKTHQTESYQRKEEGGDNLKKYQFLSVSRKLNVRFLEANSLYLHNL